jgi:hypothetical protein
MRIGLAVLLVGATNTSVRAAVAVYNDVLPARNQATGAGGIPSAGNGWTALQPNNAQPNWETNQEIIVGRSLMMGGRMDIDGNTKLRWTNLILGDRDPNNVERVGNGFVLITGPGSLFQNNPTSLDPGLPVDYAPTPAADRPDDVGFDLWVGRWGEGRFELRNGGTAEIQDAVIVGDNPGSVGHIVVDGFGSLLANGGFEASPVAEEIHQIIIGRLSTGFMTVVNGGTVVSEAANTGGADEDIIGAVIGSDPFVDNEVPELGGKGEVTINGGLSKWVVGGSLQIGGFHNSSAGALPDAEGLFAQYESDVGRGTLRIQDGAVVTVRPAQGSDPDQDDLLVAIGRFGRLEMAGGLLVIGLTSDRQDTAQLINDGVITGSGRIETGVFRNRFLGEVRINPGQSLIIDSSSEFVSAAQDAEPLANYGVVRVLGTADQRAYFEVERSLGSDLEPIIQPFQNLSVAPAPPGEVEGGLITAQHANLIFRSNFFNTGKLAFTAGDNYVVGDVINSAALMPGTDDDGIVEITGAGTRVVLENDYIDLGGFLVIAGGATLRELDRHSFISAGTLNLEVGPSLPTPITTSGDVGLEANLIAKIIGVTPGSLVVGDTFELISFAGDIGGVDLSDPLNPEVDLSVPPLFKSIAITNLATLGLAPGLVLVPEFTLNSVLLAVRSTAGHIGPDFNGDGMVDALDLAIWKMNKGITSGATVLQGDANGDGAVDGADY